MQNKNSKQPCITYGYHHSQKTRFPCDYINSSPFPFTVFHSFILYPPLTLTVFVSDYIRHVFAVHLALTLWRDKSLIATEG